MYAVVRHTFEQDVSDRLKSVGEWKHHVWLFEEEEEAMTFAITLLANFAGSGAVQIIFVKKTPGGKTLKFIARPSCKFFKVSNIPKF